MRETSSTNKPSEPMETVLDLRSLLRASDYLASIPDELISVLSTHFSPRTLSAGEYLIRQGDVATKLYVVTKGRVNILAEGEDGSPRLLDQSGPGEILGEMALLTGEARTASVVADETSEVMEVAAQQVHQAIQHHPELAQLLTNVVANRLGSQERDALAGKSLGGYGIVRRLGKGGMSVVYEAVHPHSRQRVALKMLSHRLVYNQSAMENFEREFKILKLFDSPHIVRNFEKFTAFHSQFIVMEYCDGISLSQQLLDKGKLTEQETREILRPIVAALNYAHSQHVLHRDIKPANVMLSDEGTAKLVDFGLAVQTTTLNEDDANRVAGTLRYMAPEIRAGVPASPQSDYYSLGMTALELLRGRKVPLDANTNVKHLCPHVSAEFSEMISRMIRSKPRTTTDWLGRANQPTQLSRIGG